MKLPLLLQQMQNSTSSLKPSVSPFWLLIHLLCCVVSTVLGFRFSRLLFFLFFSTSPLFNSLSATFTTTTTTTITTITTTTETLSLSIPSNSSSSPVLPSNQTIPSHPIVGRHGIRVRPFPYPDPTEVLKAHNIIKLVQLEQRKFFSVKNPRPIIAITPTYSRAEQAMYLNSLSNTLRLVNYQVIWIVVEAGGISNGTRLLLEKSRVPFLHLGFDGSVPEDMMERRNFETKMRVHALRIIKEQKMEGVILFTDESNIHDLKFFDEAQKVKSISAVHLSFLTPPNQQNDDYTPKTQGPICDPNGKITGWKTFEFSNDDFAPKGRTEWAGFVLDSKFVFEKDLDVIKEDLLGLVENGSNVDPLYNCQENVLVWWIRSETLPDTNFPQGWVIENGLPSTNTRR